MIRNYTYTKNDFPKFEGWEMSTHLFLYTLNLLRHERMLLHFKVLHCRIQNCSVAFSVLKQLS